MFKKDHFKTVEIGLEKTIFLMTYDPAFPFGHLSEKNSNICTSGDKHKNVYSHDVYSSEKQEHPQTPTNERIDTSWYLSTTKYSTTVKMSESSPFATE